MAGFPPPVCRGGSSVQCVSLHHPLLAALQDTRNEVGVNLLAAGKLATRKDEGLASIPIWPAANRPHVEARKTRCSQGVTSASFSPSRESSLSRCPHTYTFAHTNAHHMCRTTTLLLSLLLRIALGCRSGVEKVQRKLQPAPSLRFTLQTSAPDLGQMTGIRYVFRIIRVAPPLFFQFLIKVGTS